MFLVINVMAFTIISIREAANDALANLEQKPFDYFYLSSKYETDPNTIVTEGSTISYMSVPHLITDQVIEKIKSLDGIKTYATHFAASSGTISDKNGSLVELVAYNIPVGQDDAALIKGVSDSDLYFGSKITLAAGKHLTPDFKHEAMVNVRFAKKNNLNIGDKLTIATPGNTSGVEVALTGIYEFADKTDETELSPSELSENIIYVGHDTGLALDDGKKGIISVKFFIGQPDQLAAVFSQVQKLDIDWNKYELFNEADTSVIDAESVKDVSNQFSVLTAVIIVAGLLVISLVLMLQTKMRVNEIAILLSLGFTKNTILLQHMFEAMIPAGISIVISYFIGRYLISSELFRAINLSVNKIQMVTIVQIIVINISLLIASIWVASIRILSEPPKAISEKNN